MNAHGRRPLDPETAEQMLSGHPTARRDSRRLAERLSAASAVAFPGELAGEHAAVAAFLAAAEMSFTPQSGRRSMIKSTLVAKLLTLKAAAVALAAVSAGGVALAASTGVLPNPLNQAPENPGHSVSAPAHSNATPSPSLVGLCTAYLAGAGKDHGKALENPAFGALITAAGGAENVDSYCADLGVTEPGADRGSGDPTDPSTGKPSDVGPSQLPTSPPSHPTGPPSHPSGPPTSPSDS
jgi:hypothetical protein